MHPPTGVQTGPVRRLEAGKPKTGLVPPRGTDGRAGIYIVAPHANLLMRYDDAEAAQGLVKDLERLLRLSRIG